jgi:2-polyprenyl-3-methyl-5-hydroxy-6-metoxy-1,4-benzoquinol methylase
LKANHLLAPTHKKGTMQLANKAFHKSLSVASDSHFCNFMWTRMRKYPRSGEHLLQWNLFNSFWYYDIELLPGIIARGQYPETTPFLPRMLLRTCNLKGADCLDIGSMEGLIPVLMCRQGARRVLATDFNFHCYTKMGAVKKYYGVDFSFKRLDLLYDLANKIASSKWRGFDLINLSGVLYHVLSPFHVLAGLRPLLKKGGLMIVSTNVINRDDFSMEFNNSGKLQAEANTFWYLSIKMFDYMLRYFQLVPIDCLYYKHPPNDAIRYAREYDAGYLSVVCRAVSDGGAAFNDKWLSESVAGAWEYLLCNQKMMHAQAQSTLSYSAGSDPIDLSTRVGQSKPLATTPYSYDTHLLKLEDRI